MTTQFSALTEALALVAGDEMAVARGSETVRMALAVLRAGLAGSTDTAAQVLAKLLTVDGAGSDLDADLLDGLTPEEVAATGHRGNPLPTYIATGSTWNAAEHTYRSNRGRGSTAKRRRTYCASPCFVAWTKHPKLQHCD